MRPTSAAGAAAARSVSAASAGAAVCASGANRTTAGPPIASARPGGGAHGCGSSLLGSGLEPADPLSAPADPFVATGAGDHLLSGRGEALPLSSSTIGAAANESIAPAGDAARRVTSTAELTRRGAPRPSPPRIDRVVRCSSTSASAAVVLLGEQASMAAGASAAAACSEVDAVVRPDSGAAAGAAGGRFVGSLTCTGYAGRSGGSASSWLLLTAKTRGDGANPALLVSARGAEAPAPRPRPGPGECPPRSDGMPCSCTQTKPRRASAMP